MNKSVYQIAIDGPAGSGKSSIAKLVAKKLNFQFINTGGMFRCYAIALKNVDLNNENELRRALKSAKVELKGDQLFLNGDNVTDLANSAEISLIASKIATNKIVREQCLIEQRMIASKQNCVMEGRDTTSVVLPNATLKIFLTASVEIRAKRRWEQAQKTQPLDQVTKDLIARDYQDTHRKVAPLIFTDACKKIDGDNLTVEQTADLIIDLFKKETGNV